MLSRRTFLMTSGALAVSPISLSSAQTTPQTILKLKRRVIDVNGKAASVYGIQQPDGRYGMTTDVNTIFNVRVENELDEPSLIHWHGLTPPSNEDGVPEISGPIIPSRGSLDYRFPLTFSGTYWMHSHYGLQEQALMAAPLIIRDPKHYRDRQEIVVMLADFSFTPAEEIFAKLKYSGNKDSNPAMSGDMASMDMGHDMAAHQGMTMNNNMSMPNAGTTSSSMADLNDVAYDAYLANERTLADPEIFYVEKDARILLRIINSAAMSAFHVDMGDVDATLVAVDGQDVEPIISRRFPIVVGQRLDLIIDLPGSGKAFPVLFILEGERKRTGVILAQPNAAIGRLEDKAKENTPALDLDLEMRLKAASPLSRRKADRSYALDLTGDMARYVWSINNNVWNKDTPPLPIAKNERVELTLTNRTMMPHPMHLHGHRFQVVEIDNMRISGAVRDTILVPPNKRVVLAFDADNPGTWAFHCHLAYHMHAGMFTTFKYTS